MGLTLELGKRGGAEATLVINYITKPSRAKAFYEVFILLPLRTYVIKIMILDTFSSDTGIQKSNSLV